MAEEILITPEITMHEEPGEIRFNRGQVAVEMDDIPADVSITRVNKPTLSSPKPFLKIRNDLTSRMPPALRPPPLQRAPIPPMPRLKLGAGNNPLASMYNMLPPGAPRHPRPFHAPPHMAFVAPRMRPPPPAQIPALIPPPLPPPNLNGVRHGLPGSSLLRPRHHNPVVKRATRPPATGSHHKLVPQEPLPLSAGRGSKKNPKVIVPPPLSGNVVASKVMQNGGAYTLPDLNITVTSVPRAAKPMPVQALQVFDIFDHEY